MNELMILAFQIGATSALIAGQMVYFQKIRYPNDDEPEWYKVAGGLAVTLTLAALSVGVFMYIWTWG